MAFVVAEFQYSERQACNSCKLVDVDSSSYRYEPRPDRNGKLREALVALARQRSAGGMVGAGRFERPTPCAQGRCATRLRYAPTFCASLMLNHFPYFRYRPVTPTQELRIPSWSGGSDSANAGESGL